MAVIQSLRSAKQVLELNLENLEEKRAASADARSGTFFAPVEHPLFGKSPLI